MYKFHNRWQKCTRETTCKVDLLQNLNMKCNVIYCTVPGVDLNLEGLAVLRLTEF